MIAWWHIRSFPKIGTKKEEMMVNKTRGGRRKQKTREKNQVAFHRSWDKTEEKGVWFKGDPRNVISDQFSVYLLNGILKFVTLSSDSLLKL